MVNKRSRNSSKQQEPPRTRRETALRVTLNGLVYLWIFILGILVGRGSAPVEFNVERLQDKLAALKKTTVEKTVQRYRIAFKEVDKQVDLGFHEALKGAETDLSANALKLPDPSVSKKSTGPDVPAEKEENALPKKTRDPEFQKKKKKVEIPAPWIIQVAATQDKTEGNQLTERLKRMGYPAYLTTAEIPGKGTWFRIRVGGYSGRSEAEADCDRLKKKLPNKRLSPVVISP